MDFSSPYQHSQQIRGTSPTEPMQNISVVLITYLSIKVKKLEKLKKKKKNLTEQLYYAVSLTGKNMCNH